MPTLPEDLAVVEYLRALQRSGYELPRTINVNNGSQFRSNVFQSWCAGERISINFIDPGKPDQNGFVESFNGRLRNGLLNRRSWSWQSPRQADDQINEWLSFNNPRHQSAWTEKAATRPTATSAAAKQCVVKDVP